MSEVTEAQIRERLVTVRGEIEQHEVALAYLRQEVMELDITVRVFERFNLRPDYSRLLALGSEVASEEELEARKPKSIPTMPNMIGAVLAFAAVEDGAWLEPRQIAYRIREKWWPDAPSTSVGPIAWRLAREGRLKKEGSLYTVLENETPAGDTAGGSERGNSEAPEIV